MGKNFQEELNNFITSFSNALFALKGDYKESGNTSTLYDLLIQNLEKIFDFSGSLDNNAALAENKEYESFPDTIKAVRDTLNQIISQPTENLKEGPEKNLNKDCKNLQNLLDGEIAHKIEETAETRNAFVKGYLDGSEEKAIKEQFDKIGLNGHPMSINDCKNFSIENPDMDKTIDQLMWLSVQDYMRSRLYGNNGMNVYTKAIDHITDEFQTAPADIQQKFAVKFMRQQIAVRDACLNKYNEAFKNCPEGKDPELYAHTVLNESPEYLSLCALTNFKSTALFGQKLVQYERAIAVLNPEHPEIKDISNRPSTKMNDLANGDMAKFFIKRGLMYNPSYLEAHEIENFEKKLSENGFLNNKSLDNIIKENDNLIKDTGKSSESMMDMRNAVNAFLDLNHGDPDNTPGYNEKLQAAIDAVENYKELHKGYRFTASGKERVRIANSLSESLTNLKKEQEAKRDPKYIPDNLANGIGLIENSLAKDAGDAISAGLTKKQFVEKVKKYDLEPTADYQEEFNDGLYKYKKIAPETNIPGMILSANIFDTPNKKAIHDIAIENFAKSKYDFINISKVLDKAVEYGAINDQDREFLNSRDLPMFLFEAGDDGKTIHKNFDRANKFLGKTLNKRDPKYQEKLQKAQAEVVLERMDEISQIDYDKYLSLSDKELAENFVEISKKSFPLAVMNGSIKELMKNNPYITDEMLAESNTIVNKYSSHYPYLAARMDIMASNYYSSVNEKEFDKLTSMDGGIIGSFQSIDDSVTRYHLSVNNLITNYNNIYTTLIKNSFAEKAYDNKIYENIPFFDENGEKISSMDVLDKSKKGILYTLEDGDPATLKAFSYGGNVLSFKEESLEKHPEICEKIIATVCKDKDMQAHIDKIKNGIENSKNAFEQKLKDAINEGDLAKMASAGSRFMYFNKLQMKSDKMSLPGLIDATNRNKIANLTEKITPTIKEYLKTLTVPALKDLAENKNFNAEFTKGFAYFTKDINPDTLNAVKDQPEKSKDLM